MRLSRYVGFVDLGILAVVFVLIALPPREMFASAAHRGTDADQFGLALAEARSIAHPDDTLVIADLERRLVAEKAGFRDWAVVETVRAVARAQGTPQEWRALLSASVAYIDRVDVKPALDYANRALSSCRKSAQSCPSWEEVRMDLYQRSLDAGVKSGIDPWRDPIGFRKAGERALRPIRVNASGAPSP
jgi:hypothetical protein